MSGIQGPLAFVIDEVEKVVNERHEKYGPGNITGSPGGPLNGLRVRLHDKLARINNAIDNGGMDYGDESFRDTFIDIVGYGLIGLLVLDGQWPGAPKPAEDRVTFHGSPKIGEALGSYWDQVLKRKVEHGV